MGDCSGLSLWLLSLLLVYALLAVFVCCYFGCGVFGLNCASLLLLFGCYGLLFSGVLFDLIIKLVVFLV